MGTKLYIHIGYPKTGTTYLQQEVFPKMRGLNYIGERSIYDCLRKIFNQNEFSFNYRIVKAELAKSLTSGINLISNERLVGAMLFKFVNDKLIADRLSILFPSARIILTIRNQYDLIKSLYRQYIHQGGTKEFNQFFRYDGKTFFSSYQLDDHVINPEMFNYLNLLNYYVKLFGIENVFVIPYEKLVNDPCLFVKGMLSFIGFDDVPDFENVIYNKGYGDKQLRLARFLNRFLKSDFNKNGIVPALPVPAYGRFDAQLLNRLLQSRISFKLLGSKISVEEDLKNDIKRLFYDSNMEISTKFSLDLHGAYKKYYF